MSCDGSNTNTHDDDQDPCSPARPSPPSAATSPAHPSRRPASSPRRASMTAQTSVPSENWDDDFEFGQSNSTKIPRLNADGKSESANRLPLEPRLSVVSSHLSEDWDAGDAATHRPPRVPIAGSSRGTGGKSGVSSRLDNWAEPGPSTPIKHGGAQAPSENWDDDFVDKGDSPPDRRHHVHRASHHILQHHHAHTLRTRHSYHTPPRPKHSVEPENWDDDFDDPMNPASSTSPSKTDNDNTPVTKRSRREAYADTSDEDDEAGFGFSEDKEEDRTVTAHSRTAPMRRPGSSNSHLHSYYSSPPPVPALPSALSPSPIEPFPRSPTVSVFSIPTTSGRNSIGHFNSTSHLVLSGAAASLAIRPPSPPTRERRRLRKKSRPPHMDNNVFELIEEQRDTSSPPLPPSTPERDRASSPPMVPMVPSSSVEATPTGGSKTPLLSRIGSVKKWGVRRKRASTGPAEVMMQEFQPSSGGVVEQDGVPRPPSSLEQTQTQTPSHRNRNSAGGARSAWFFRPGGAHYGAGSPPPGQAELKHERSLERAQLRPCAGGEGSGQVPTTPSKNRKVSRRKASGILLEYASSSELTGDASSSASGVAGTGKPSLGPGRRPSSMQVPNDIAHAVGNGSHKFSSVGTRHASYGSSVGRISSSRVFSTPTPTDSMEDLPPMPALPLQEGSRNFMGSVRKISLVGGKKHKKRSSVEITPNPPDLGASLPGGTGSAGDRELDADGDARMQTQPQAYTPDLLPPIELHPPSPPRTINATRSMTLKRSDGTEPMAPSTSAPASITITPIAPSSPLMLNKAMPGAPSSPQSASLGRATQAPNPPSSSASVQRRNSLGDLKIPARISQAQIGLKRDLGMVREFAISVDRLKELQSAYHHLLAEVQIFLDGAPPSRATSPNMFNLIRPRSRLRSNTSPPTNISPGPGSFLEHKHIAATFHAITVKYKISWECAELLIELGGGTPAPASPGAGPLSTTSAPSALTQAELDHRKNRERAVTLSGEDSKQPAVTLVNNITAVSPTSGPPSGSWRASTGRHDLSQRQLVLLRDMLNNGEPPGDDVPENVNRNWRWGDAMSSTVTLPSEESGSRGADQGEHTTKKRRGRKMGLTGLRDLLRMLKRSHSEQVATPPVSSLPAGPSTTSLSTESSHYSHHYPHGQIGADGAHGVSKVNAGPESVRATKDALANSPYSGPALNHKSSPRRPSLASIFRIGQKNKGGASSSTGESSQGSRSDVRSASQGSDMTGEEEDWDRIESAIDLDTAARALGIEGTTTIKGRRGRMSPFLSENPGSSHRPVTPRRVQDTAALRLEMEASPRSIRPMRSTRLSNVEEVDDGKQQSQSSAKIKNRVSLPRTSPIRPPSRGGMPGNNRTGSVRSAPPQSQDDPQSLPEIKLSMTPENIRPLLENAKEVHTRCHDCIRELRTLLDVMPASSPASVS